MGLMTCLTALPYLRTPNSKFSFVQLTFFSQSFDIAKAIGAFHLFIDVMFHIKTRRCLSIISIPHEKMWAKRLGHKY